MCNVYSISRGSILFLIPVPVCKNIVRRIGTLVLEGLYQPPHLNCQAYLGTKNRRKCKIWILWCTRSKILIVQAALYLQNSSYSYFVVRSDLYGTFYFQKLNNFFAVLKSEIYLN
jgi:hypothetical protein